jgi:AraC family transcriptional regulator
MPNRPVLVDTGDGVQPAISEKPVLATSPGTWSGFELEDLRLPAGELPPQATLLQHVICAVTSAAPVNLHWRENGGAHSQTIRRGDLLFRSQQELVDFRWDKPLNVLILGIGIDTLRSVSADMPGASNCQLVPAFGIKDSFLHRLMLTLREDLASGCPTGRLLGESICTAMAVHALQRYSVSKPRLKNYRRGLSAERLELVLVYIDAHLDEDLSIKQLASLAGTGLHYFRKLFSISTGLTVHEYVMQARIARARHLLHRTHLSIVEIALLSGFSSQSHLTAEFRRRLGVTPAVYRSTLAPSSRNAATAG